VLTINCAGAIVEITNHGTLEAKGGELDIVREAVTNTGTLQAIDGGTVKLSTLTVSNEYGTVAVEHGSTIGSRWLDDSWRHRQHRRDARFDRRQAPSPRPISKSAITASSSPPTAAC